MAYEEMKRWGFERKRNQFAKRGQVMTPEDDKLVGFSRLWILE
jgi:solute carrier family 25 folate transporter 32